jgi:SAM-dependent methyltransferase
MRRAHLCYLVCPDCKNQLELQATVEAPGGRVQTGKLVCHRCQETFPIERYIPRFVARQNYASGFGLEWTLHARTQYDRYTRTAISETRFFDQTRWPRDLSGETVLEVGSGSGRFTEEAAATGAMIVSVEYSFAVEANYASNGSRHNVLMVQADLYQLPLRNESFDRVFCIGVLQHTPDVEGAFRRLPLYLKPGGSLVIDVYRKPSGFRKLLATKYWVRPLTRRMNPERLYRLVRRYISCVWWLARLVSRIPRIGRKLNWILLIADYRGVYPLSEEQLREWAVLDTFDMLAPVYDSPQTIETVRRWFATSHFAQYEVQYGYNGIEARGTRA